MKIENAGICLFTENFNIHFYNLSTRVDKTCGALLIPACYLKFYDYFF